MALGSTITQVTDSGIKPGITFPSFVSSGIATATNFKTGTTNVHSTGIEAGGINVTGGDTKIGTAATVWRDGGAVFSGIVSETKFVGDGSILTGLQLSKELTIGVRVGAAVTFTVTGSSFNVLNRSGGNVPISI